MKLPRLVVDLRGLLPPTAGADHVEPAVAVDIADAEAMCKACRSGNRLARRTRRADGMHFPKLRRVFSRREISHLPFVAFHLLVFRLKTHDENALAGAEQINILRGLIAGAVPDYMFLPHSLGALGILQPVAWNAGKVDD